MLRYPIPRNTFSYYFKEGLIEIVVLNQVMAITATGVLSLYGNAGDIGTVWGHSFFISNILGFSIKFFGAVAYRLFYQRMSHTKISPFLLWFPAIALGTFFGSELAFYVIKIIFYTQYPSFPEPEHFIFLGGNFILGLILYASAITYYYIKKKLEKKTAEHQQSLHLQTKSQLAALQAKINPHFLFNTLNAMLGQIYNAPEKVENMILNLSNIYHKVLKLPEDTKILLHQEMELVKEYLEIEKIRMGDRLEFNIHLDPKLKKAKIPPLLIEPLVENAIIHGIGPKSEGGEIKIEVSGNQGFIKVSVADNGIGMVEPDSKAGYGLYSIQERLRLIYADKASFSITSLPFGGIDVRMELPYED